MAEAAPSLGNRQVTIRRGAEVRDLARLDVDPATVGQLPVRTARWGDTTVEEMLHRHDALSLVVLHRGGIAFEWYATGADPARRNLSYSVTKSFTGTLTAAAIAAGTLTRSSRIGDLLPELAASGFGDATVGDAADMTVAIAYDEDYEDAGDPSGPRSRFGFLDYLIAAGFEPPDTPIAAGAPRSIRAFLGRVGAGAAPHGEVFAYATPVTDALGWMLERASGRGYPDLLTDAIWSRIGAERDALLSVDLVGTPLMGGGLQVTTRDLARFGLLIAEQGSAADDAVLPPAALEAIRDGGDHDAFQRGGHYDYLAGYSYRDQWWMPGGSSRPMSAWGIFGQLLWVDPDAEVVIASHAGGAAASDERRDLEQDAMCRALTEASAAWS